ncbi:MAG TPA: AarF/UbiB family protein [Thermodesulfovibrionales bacterium]|nr:AarF/UbiB family protein [Thermodesulfovibrionales bacterium]
MAPKALAEGSVGLVVPFTMREGGSVSKHGVFKVLRPGVEERLQEELTIWSALGPFLEERSLHYGLPELSYRETLEGVAKQLLNEIRLDGEQEHLVKAAALYANFPQVLIPRLFPFSTARITAMERVYGSRVTQGGAPETERRRLAELICEALIARPFWSGASVVTFHADPHAGNLFRTRDGRLAILDWSLVVHLAKAEMVKIIDVLLAALTLDERGLCLALSNLAKMVPDESTLRAAAQEGLRQVRAGTFPALDWMVALLDRLATSCRVVFSEEMTLFRKALLALMGALADISNAAVADGVLIGTAMRKLREEFFSRLLASPRSRAFSTHLSNEDLFLLWVSWPVTAARFWLGIWGDLLAEVRTVLGGGRTAKRR